MSISTVVAEIDDDRYYQYVVVTTKTNKKTQTIDNITYREIDMGIEWWYILNAGK